LLIDKNAIFRVADTLAARDFYDPKHEKIYEAILELHEKRQPIDLVTLTGLLKERNLLKDIGGSAYLAELTNQVATASHAEQYAKVVRDRKASRDLIDASAKITERVFNPLIELEDVLDEAEQLILSISQKSLPQNFVPLKDELKGAYERIEKIHGGEGQLRGVPTGFEELDALLSGMQKSELVILGARPSLGKTALVLDMARNVAIRSGVTVGIFTLEMSREQLIDRLIAAESQVSLWHISTGRIAKDTEFEMIQGALDRLSKTAIFIDDTPSLNVMQMRSMARRLQIEHGLGLLVVDYLQLIKPRVNFESMVQQVTEISRSLKELARELKVPVLAVSQLSRNVEQREERRPRLSDLRESGSIEQDADVVMFIYRKDRDKTDAPVEEQNIAEIIVAKHRNGPTGSVKLRFDTERISFKPLEKRFGEQSPFGEQ